MSEAYQNIDGRECIVGDALSILWGCSISKYDGCSNACFLKATNDENVSGR